MPTRVRHGEANGFKHVLVRAWRGRLHAAQGVALLAAGRRACPSASRASGGRRRRATAGRRWCAPCATPSRGLPLESDGMIARALQADMTLCLCDSRRPGRRRLHKVNAMHHGVPPGAVAHRLPDERRRRVVAEGAHGQLVTVRGPSRHSVSRTLRTDGHVHAQAPYKGHTPALDAPVRPSSPARCMACLAPTRSPRDGGMRYCTVGEAARTQTFDTHTCRARGRSPSASSATSCPAYRAARGRVRIAALQRKAETPTHVRLGHARATSRVIVAHARLGKRVGGPKGTYYTFECLTRPWSRCSACTTRRAVLPLARCHRGLL